VRYKKEIKNMKRIVIAAIPSLVAATAFAGVGGQKSFPLYSSASGTVRTSSAYPLSGYKVKTLTVSGATLASNAASSTYKNMSGTSIAECGPTITGPFTTAVANDYAQTAVSRTTNGTMTFTDACEYVRVKWTGGTTGTKLKIWLNWSE